MTTTDPGSLTEAARTLRGIADDLRQEAATLTAKADIADRMAAAIDRRIPKVPPSSDVFADELVAGDVWVNTGQRVSSVGRIDATHVVVEWEDPSTSAVTEPVRYRDNTLFKVAEPRPPVDQPEWAHVEVVA